MNRQRAFLGLLSSATLAVAAAAQTAVQPSISYQGQLKFAGNPATGAYDLTFTLWDAAGSGSPPVGGNPIGGAVNKLGFTVANGLFSVILNELGEFGPGAFAGDARWLQVAVNGTPLSPRQPLTAAPFAVYALSGPAASGPWAANGTAIYNTNAGNIGIGDDDPLAFLHVGPEHLALGPADLHSEDVIIAGGDGVLGIYSDAAGGAGNGSAIVLGEIGAGLTDKWGIYRDTFDAGSDLHISYGPDPDYAANLKFMTFDAAGGKVGIGTASPDAKLHVAGDLRSTARVAFGNEGVFGAGLVFDRIFDFTQRITGPPAAAAWCPFHSEVFADPAADMSALLVGHRLTTRVASGNPRNLDFVGGCDISAVHGGNGVVSDLRGLAVFTTAAGPVTEQIGLHVGSDGISGATIGSNRALDIRSGHRTSGGSIANDYSLYINTPSRNSPLTNHYGIYLANQGSPVSFPTSYAIYSDGGQSYFRDAVGIGTSSPGHLLDIAGRMRVRQSTPPTTSNTAGVWFYQETPAEDRAFIGMRNDGLVGFYGTEGAGWGLVMDVASGNVGVGTEAPAVPLHVAGGGDISPAGGGYFIIGDVGSGNLGMDQNEIMARNNGVGSDLFVNHNGGNILLSAGVGGENVGIGTSTPTLAKVQIDVTNQRGVYGTNNSATLATAYFDNLGSGPAGVFDGSVTVIGSLSKSSGSFRIDHPLDPANKYLYHSFVESPDMKNLYDGVVVTDERGCATIEMPDWFEPLNRDFRYQLTVIDGADGDEFVQAKVVREIGDRTFTIRSSRGGAKVSWQVTGTRQDPWAESHRIPVEQDKPEHERGKYQHPELYGHPPEMGIGFSPEHADSMRSDAATIEGKMPE